MSHLCFIIVHSTAIEFRRTRFTMTYTHKHKQPFTIITQSTPEHRRSVPVWVTSNDTSYIELTSTQVREALIRHVDDQANRLDRDTLTHTMYIPHYSTMHDKPSCPYPNLLSKLNEHLQHVVYIHTSPYAMPYEQYLQTPKKSNTLNVHYINTYNPNQTHHLTSLQIWPYSTNIRYLSSSDILDPSINNYRDLYALFVDRNTATDKLHIPRDVVVYNPCSEAKLKLKNILSADNIDHMIYQHMVDMTPHTTVQLETLSHEV